MDLSQKAVENLGSANPPYLFAVEDAQAKLFCEGRINTASGRASVNQGPVVLRPQLGCRTGDAGVIPDLHRYNGAAINEALMSWHAPSISETALHITQGEIRIGRKRIDAMGLVPQLGE